MRLGAYNLFSLRQCGKGFHAHIGSVNAVPRAMAIIAGIRYIDLYGKKPLIRLAGDAGSQNFTGKPQGFLHGHPPDFWHFDMQPLQAKFVIRDIKAIPRFSFLLEDRVLILMRPQPLPRGLEIGKRLAMGVAMNVLQPGKCRVLDRIKLFFERARVRMAARHCPFHSPTPSSRQSGPCHPLA